MRVQKIAVFRLFFIYQVYKYETGNDIYVSLGKTIRSVKPNNWRNFFALSSVNNIQFINKQVSYNNFFFSLVKILIFVPSNYDLRTSLIFNYQLKKSALEAHRMLVEAYGQHALGKTQCNEWLNKFKSGDFDVMWWWSNATKTCTTTKCDPTMHFSTFKSHEIDFEGGKMGAAWIDWKTMHQHIEQKRLGNW